MSDTKLPFGMRLMQQVLRQFLPKKRHGVSLPPPLGEGWGGGLRLSSWLSIFCLTRPQALTPTLSQREREQIQKHQAG